MKRLFLAIVLAAGFTGLTAAAGQALSAESLDGDKGGKKGKGKGKGKGEAGKGKGEGKGKGKGKGKGED